MCAYEREERESQIRATRASCATNTMSVGGGNDTRVSKENIYIYIYINVHMYVCVSKRLTDKKQFESAPFPALHP